MTKNKLITVLSDYHQKEYDELIESKLMFDLEFQILGFHNMLSGAVISRISWLEFQSKLKVESILELCRTGT